jgi:hypothetical protein
MKRTLVTAVAAVGLGLITAPVQAGGYAANGHTTWPEQVLFPSAHDTLPGPWIVTGRGNPSTFDGSADPKMTLGNDDHGCWYDPDLPKCE